MEELLKILNTYNQTKDINKTGELLELNPEDLKRIIFKYKLSEYTSKMFWGVLKGNEPEPLKQLVQDGKPYGEIYYKVLYSREEPPQIIEKKVAYYVEVPK